MAARRAGRGRRRVWTVGAGQGCVWGHEGFVCGASVFPVAAVGEACESAFGCAPDTACLSAAGGGAPCAAGDASCSTPYCDLSQPDPSIACSDPGHVCVSWWGGRPAPAGLESLGHCTLP
ncbi:MAG: hypothetical protein K0V04_35290 [Deltaproteobacteria bacterium]|nr:hypothetical protein [Deltaproteobacteria bacterium]